MEDKPIIFRIIIYHKYKWKFRRYLFVSENIREILILNILKYLNKF